MKNGGETYHKIRRFIKGKGDRMKQSDNMGKVINIEVGGTGRLRLPALKTCWGGQKIPREEHWI